MRSGKKGIDAMKLTASVLLVIGVIFICVGFIIGVLPHITKDLALTEAEITDIVYAGHDSDGTVNYKTQVRYTVDGKQYSAVLNYYSSSNRPGDTIEIYYDIAQPDHALASAPVLIIVFTSVGLALTAGGVCILIVQRRRKKNNVLLRETGRRISAEAVSIIVNPHLEVNGRNPYVVTCEYSDPFTGTYTEYKSANLWEYPELHPGDPVYVYVDRDDTSKYFVDL